MPTYSKKLKMLPSAKIIGVSFGEVDAFSIQTVEAYEKAILEAKEKGQTVRALLLANPHNPLGMWL